MNKVTIEIPDQLMAKLKTHSESLQNILIKALENYLVNEKSELSNNYTEKIVPKFDWDEWEKRIEEVGDDSNQLSTEEICEIVREVRREMKQ